MKTVNKILERKIIPAITKNFHLHKIHVLVGSRQVGKTCIMKYLENKLENTIYLDVDRAFDLSMFESVDHFSRYVEIHRPDKKEKVTVFIDEFQHLPVAGKIFKAIHDHFSNIRLVLSGSSSLNIMKSLDESIAGRKRVYTIYPLDFEEYLHFSANRYYDYFCQTPDYSTVPEIFPELSRQFEMFALMGGYPGVTLLEHQNEKIDELNEIIQSYIEKDIRAITQLDNILSFNKLLRRLGLNIGSLLNLQSLAADVGLNRDKLEKHLLVLANTFIIQLVQPFYKNKINELKKMPKLFFYDNGIRNHLILNYQELETRVDKGALIENCVWTELAKNKSILQEIKFWRTTSKSEIDFIIASQGRYFPIEVKYQNNVSTIPRAMKSFIDTYASHRAWIMTKNQFFEVTYNNCKITFLPAFFAAKILKKIA
ncbi:MAG: ATP-binding protein [bacterium]